jgi:uncharacterized LabA/DUF88 family protein
MRKVYLAYITSPSRSRPARLLVERNIMTVVYVDGENLLHRVEDVLSARKMISHKTEITHFDLAGLVTQLLPEEDEVEIRYYGTKLRSAGISDSATKLKAERMIDSQRRLKRDLDKQGVVFIASGNLRVKDGVICRSCGHQETVFQEKGVDVRLAVDLVREARKDGHQVILSSDSDLLPAIKAAKEAGSRITYLAFEETVNRALVAVTDSARTYTAKQAVDGFMGELKTNGN